MKPKVSVAILTHDDSEQLKRAIDSVLAQSYQNIEVIVIYDGPVNDAATKKITATYRDRLKYYKREDGGVAEALNFAIKKASGDYFSWLSSEDTYHPEKIEKQVALTEAKSKVIVISDWDSVNQNNRRIQRYTTDDAVEKHPSCFLAFAKDTQLNTCAMLFPIAILRDRGPFSGALPPARDFRMLNQLFMAGARIRVINESLLCYASYSEERYSSDPGIITDYDFAYSDIIATLSYDAILAYFGTRESAVEYYKQALDSGRPRSAAFFMEKLIRAGLDSEGGDAAKESLLNNLSGLSESKMATSVDSLLSKISRPSSRKKLMFSSAHWLTGGMERVMSTLFRELEKDYEIFLITPYDDRESQITIPDHVISIKISDENFQKYFDVTILSYALLLDIDVITGVINLFDKQLNLYRLCAGTKIKTIASNHEYYFYPYKSPTHYDVVEKRLSACAKCDAIVWPNSFNAALCGMYLENSYVIGNPNNFKVAQQISPTKDNVVICVGRFNDYVKRIDRILECFSLILKRVPDAKLLLVGKYSNDTPIKPGDRTTVNNIIDRLGIPPSSLNFVGEVSNVQDYYAQAKVLMLTSNSEGFGMVLNEAACFGVPSVCNYMPGIEDLITNGGNGYITEQGDITSMALRVSDILSNNELQEELSNSARKKAKTYDSKHIGDKWRYLINSLLEVKDKDALHEKLSQKIGYVVHDQSLFSRVLSRELNEIFYMSINEGGQYRITNPTLLVLSKVVNLPKRLKANIQHEGVRKTGNKIASRSYRLARNKLKI